MATQTMTELVHSLPRLKSSYGNTQTYCNDWPNKGRSF